MRTTSSLLLLLLTVSLCHAQETEESTELWVNNFQQELAEQMLIDGRQLLEEANFEDAERQFFDALQVVKVNNGMTSALQIPVLKSLIESQLAQEDWSSIDQYLAYFAWLNGEIYRSNFSAFLEGSDVLSTLYMNAAADTSNPQSAHYLISSKNLNWNAVSAIEANYGKESPLLTSWLYKVVTSHFYQSSLVRRRGMTSYDYKTDEPGIVNGWSLSKNEFIQKSHGIGVELLERIRDIQLAQSNHEGAAIAQLYLADWEAVFDSGEDAIELYKLANQQLLEAGVDQATIDKLFSQNSILPESEFSSSVIGLMDNSSENETSDFIAWSPNFPAVSAPTDYAPADDSPKPEVSALVSFDLNMGLFTELMGFKEIRRTLFTKTNLQILSISNDNEFLREQALRDVSLLRLRPRFVEGELVPSENIAVNYIFSSQMRPVLVSDN